MNFQSVNPINVRLNLVSGNLLPMTAEDMPYSLFWRIYSSLVWLLEVIQAIVLIPGCLLVPKEKALRDGLIGLVVTVEVLCFFVRIFMRRDLVEQLIQKFNNILRVEDEMMRRIVTATMKSIENPIKFYWVLGVLSILVWGTPPLLSAFQKNTFFYVDYRMPVAYTKEPFSTIVFVGGSFVVIASSMYIFTKKVGIDSYVMNMILLLTAQYKYTALKLSMIFQDKMLDNNHDAYEKKKHYSNINSLAGKEIRTLCRHYNAVANVSLMLKELLSLNFSIIYVNCVFRFCCIFIMLISIPTLNWVDGSMLVTYATSGVVQLYVMCTCVQQLLDAGTEITDQAFHEEWYRYGTSIKRTFMFMIMLNNTELKLSKFEKCNLSRTSFMTIINQSYSIALLLFTT